MYQSPLSLLTILFSNMNKPPSSTENIESLMTWMRQRPRNYCQLAGELDSVLWYLHMIWVKMVERDDDYQAALHETGLDSKGLLSDQQRKEAVAEDSAATKQVQKFWEQIDTRLGVREKTSTWHSLTSNNRS